MENNHNMFSTQPYLQERWVKIGRQLKFDCTTQEEESKWHSILAQKLKSLIGLNTMQTTDLSPRITDETFFNDYIRQRVEITTEPGIIMPVFILIPRKTKPPYPVIIATHGHAGGGKVAVAGCREINDVNESIDTYHYDYGLQFVHSGFITFCPDARGMGERQEAASKGNILNESCQWINNMALPLGQTVTGMWTWDIQRLIDYIETRDDCLPNHLGCVGFSGGGLQTLWATALDNRIKCAIISGYFYGYKESLLDMYTNCSCNYVPDLYKYVDMGDIAALISPRPLLIESGTKDILNGINGLENVKSQIEIIQKAYELHHAEKNLSHEIFEGGHRWNGVNATSWMQEHL